MPGQAPITKQDARSKASSSPSSKKEPGHTQELVQKLTQALTKFGQAALICEHSLEGVLAAVGITYLAHANPASLRLLSLSNCQPALGEALIEGPRTDDASTIQLAERVYTGLERSFAKNCGRSKNGICPCGCRGACMRQLVFACASDSPDMPEIVHRYLRLVFSFGYDVRSMIADPRVSAADALARFVANECEHTRQFVRFSHLRDGSFFAVFRPKANTLPLTSGYFAARLGTERFCVADPVHGMAIFHDPDCPPSVVRLDDALMRSLVSRTDISPDEERVRAMWKLFYKKSSLTGRGPYERGYDLRASWIPKRFIENLSEMEP